jgi:hypothetical protein
MKVRKRLLVWGGGTVHFDAGVQGFLATLPISLALYQLSMLLECLSSHHLRFSRQALISKQKTSKFIFAQVPSLHQLLKF